MQIMLWLILIIAGQAVLCIVSVALIKAISYISKESRLALAHRKARNIKPAKGQVWIQDGQEDNEIFVQEIGPDGSIVLTTKNASYGNNGGIFWKDTPETWKERVNNRRLILSSF